MGHKNIGLHKSLTRISWDLNAYNLEILPVPTKFDNSYVFRVEVHVLFSEKGHESKSKKS